MINLLPPNEKKALKAARTNVLLLRYNALTLLVIGFLVASLTLVYVYLSNQRQAAETTITDNSQREGIYQSVKAEATAFRNQLADAKTILDTQISYSKAVIRLSSLFPEGTALKDRLDLNDASFSSPLTLSVGVQDELAAQRLLESFESSTEYVEKITKNQITIGDGNYPYTMIVTVSLKKGITAP